MTITTPKLQWDWGTAYDMFISLEVLHTPAEFGVRGAWASSVRKRIPGEEQEILDLGRQLFHIPFNWIHNLPTPKDAITVLFSLRQIPAIDRVCQLAVCDQESEFASLVQNIAARGSWTEQDFETYHNIMVEKEDKSISREKLTVHLDGWARAEEIGEKYPEALRVYQEVFFAEEEKRIRPALKKAFEGAQTLAEELELPDLLEELSQGLRFSEMPEMEFLTLVPSFWVTPLMYFGSLGKDHNIWVFGARPADQSLVPGETVPDALLRALKALSDPTRLKILHYLSQEPLSPAALSRKLRLRAPTVTHHLQTLRLAGLVQVTIGHGKEKKSFATRNEVVKATCQALETFLVEGMTPGPDEDE
jgi:DNA-binding transcriptional ArsR family regulator